MAIEKHMEVGELVFHVSNGTKLYGVVLRVDVRPEHKMIWAVWEPTTNRAAESFDIVLDWMDDLGYTLRDLEFTKIFDRVGTHMVKEFELNLDWVKEATPISESDIIKKEDVSDVPAIPRCPKCGRSDQIVTQQGRAVWVGTGGSKGRYKCVKCDTAFDMPEVEGVMESPRKRPLLAKGKGYVRVGPAKFIYLTEGIEINVPTIVLTGLTAGAIMGVIYAVLSRWRLTEKAQIIENYLMGKK